MNLDDFKRCPLCDNGPYKLKCAGCHYTGWVLADGRPASVKLGENEKWLKEQERKNEKFKKRHGKSFIPKTR